MNNVQTRFALLSLGIFLVGIMAGTVLADTIVQFNFNNSLMGGSEPISSVQVQLFDDQAPSPSPTSSNM